ncbi:LRR receptor-like serine threonine-protein kinase [Seminavis robusta]|uniref:LRR receptor-like serine threonine-protein kinase n=1 Tax=Seminavis robusta TaxID=568900 RepID=A0A9N8E528_9STRA|nr:LRR receptor-like serine threonine-protein kinase [Seminavis robusta]|eukprot:Sro527_g160550.1 LRR receptor-like serine threonine-protein kinase (883) ;mRNA; f:1488-4342
MSLEKGKQENNANNHQTASYWQNRFDEESEKFTLKGQQQGQSKVKESTESIVTEKTTAGSNNGLIKKETDKGQSNVASYWQQRFDEESDGEEEGPTDSDEKSKPPGKGRAVGEAKHPSSACTVSVQNRQEFSADTMKTERTATPDSGASLLRHSKIRSRGVPGAFGVPGIQGPVGGSEEMHADNASREGRADTPSAEQERPVLHEHTSGLAVAAPVVDDSRDLENARPITLDESEHFTERERAQLEKKKQTQFHITIGVLMAIALVIFFVIFAVVESEDGASKQEIHSRPVMNATNSPETEPPKTRFDILAGLLPDYTIERIQIEGTPQAFAFHWLENDTSFEFYSDKRLQQRYALATFWFSTNGEDWGPNWLNITQHECYWEHFMGCGPQYDAFGMRNSPFRFINGSCAPIGTGVSNSTEIDATTTLDDDDFLYLAMYEQPLGGEIPPEIELLTSLKVIQFYGTTIKGTIPSVVTKITWLQDLVLGDTALTGTIPSELALLTALKSLELGGTGLTGTFPSELGLLSNLVTFHIAETNVTESIPVEYSNLGNLLDFYVVGNLISGTIPSELALMSSLEWFIVWNNNLSGRIPSELAALDNVWLFYFLQNSFTGTIPTEFGTIKGIEDPRWFSPHEGQLYFSNNMMTGKIPSELGQATKLWRLYLNDNYFTGTLPTELGRCTNLQRLSIHSNSLSGTIPEELTLMRSVERLHLHSNYLSGTLPDGLSACNHTMDFRVSDNFFTGTVPHELKNWTQVAQIHLNNNEFTGQLPSELGSLGTLKELKVASNLFTGTIPTDIGLLAVNGNFKLLNLTDNENLYGSIPEELCDWASDPGLGNVVEFDCGPVCGCSCPCSMPEAPLSNVSSSLVVIPNLANDSAVDGGL